jgi:hypothetical protein
MRKALVIVLLLLTVFSFGALAQVKVKAAFIDYKQANNSFELVRADAAGG